ncbi:hypothetical protein [Acinetobacter entericus]|uniref:Uncharacterized protein n=1 Tax=Acinetobacter entericus TaxID=2989714 RepID=A0ABT3NP47_9GAMM|nr:hypothetical protein [Acinetobacter entericus]MCW8041320.1 hypothetical protein [Acinetobacter entericus]
MSNALQRLISLLPSDAEFVGTVQSADHPNYKVLVIDGSGLVMCTSATKYALDARVFVVGNEIKRGAPDGPVLQIEV